MRVIRLGAVSRRQALEPAPVYDPCTGIICPTGLSCVNGGCVDLSCHGVICAPGTRCVRGGCVGEPQPTIVATPPVPPTPVTPVVVSRSGASRRIISQSEPEATVSHAQPTDRADTGGMPWGLLGAGAALLFVLSR